MRKVLSVLKRLFFSKAAPASLLLAVNVFLYQPALIYTSNKTFLHFQWLDFLGWFVLGFFVLFLLLTLPSCIGTSFWRRAYSAILAALALFTWVATLFKGSQGLLDGQSFMLVSDLSTLWINALILLLVAVLSLLLCWYQRKNFSLFMVLIASLLMMSVAFTSIADLKKTKPADVTTKQYLTDLAHFSKQKNVLILLLDAFQADFFQVLLERNPQWLKQFSGFTYFKNATGVAPTTYLSIPTIHSGEVYKQGESLLSFYDRTVKHNSFMTLHADKNYDALLLNFYMEQCPRGVNCNGQEQFYQKDAFAEELMQLIDLSLFRISPHFLKSLVYNNGHWMAKKRFASDLPQGVVSHKVLQNLPHAMSTLSPKPTIKFFHLFNTHAPIHFDKYCHRVNRPWMREAALDQDQCAMSHVLNVLAALKQHHIYDQTAVLIMGDHGAGVPEKDQPYLGATATPLFLFKPFDAQGDLQTSLRLVNLMDVAPTLCKTTNDCVIPTQQGKDVFSKETLTNRKFHYNFYRWQQEFAGHEHLKMVSYSLQGIATETSSWRRSDEDDFPIISKTIALDSPEFFDYLGIGWSDATRINNNIPLRWVIGKDAELILPLPKNNDASITLFISTHEQNNHQSMGVWVNDQYLGKFAISQKIGTPVELFLPADRVTSKLTRLRFYFEEANLISSADNRSLAAALVDKVMIGNNAPLSIALKSIAMTTGIALAEKTAAQSKEVYQSGWGVIEKLADGRSLIWANNTKAELSLMLPKAKDVRLQFNVSTHGSNPHQRLSIWVGDTFISEHPVPVEKITPLQFIIPAHLITKEPTRLTFKFDECNSVGGIDPRKLAVAFWDGGSSL